MSAQKRRQEEEILLHRKRSPSSNAEEELEKEKNASKAKIQLIYRLPTAGIHALLQKRGRILKLLILRGGVKGKKILPLLFRKNSFELLGGKA